MKWKGEILDQSIEVNNLVFKVPFFVQKIISKLIFKYVSPSMARVAGLGLSFTGDLWNGIKEAEDRKEKILNAWKDEGIDIVIAPGFTFPGLNRIVKEKSSDLIIRKYK